MDVTIIGTGNMARTIGKLVRSGGHNLTVVGKDAESAEEVATELQNAAGDGSVTAAVGDDGLDGDVVVLAVYYPDARGAVERYDDQLAGKVVVDITNPINDSFDGLVVPPDSSATEELARLAPDAQWVKAFNTTFAGTVSAGEVAGQPLDVLIAGDEDNAKAAVSTLARDGGLNPIDAGPRSRARELESLGLLHMTLQDGLGSGFGSTVKIIA
jgi:8-hydroxy-5-deazaflavin:NADPH oxidoreductase